MLLLNDKLIVNKVNDMAEVFRICIGFFKLICMDKVPYPKGTAHTFMSVFIAWGDKPSVPDALMLKIWIDKSS